MPKAASMTDMAPRQKATVRGGNAPLILAWRKFLDMACWPPSLHSVGAFLSARQGLEATKKRQDRENLRQNLGARFCRPFLRVLPVVLLFVVPGFLAAAGPSMERRDPGPAGVATPQPGLFQDKCGRCHKRAGPLVRAQLTLADGTLVGADSGQDLRAFMRRHYGRPSAEEIEAIYAALLRIAKGEGRFLVRCGICHRSAERMAHNVLVVKDGTLRGRYSGRDIEAFLLGHGTESAEEAAFFTEVLRRQRPPRP